MSHFWDLDCRLLPGGTPPEPLLPAHPGWEGFESDAEEPALRRAFRTVAARLGLVYADMYNLDAEDDLHPEYGTDPDDLPGVLYWSGNWAHADSGRLELQLPPAQLARVLAALLHIPE